jgi:NADH-quinone oxidoreductase subunit L
MILAFLSIVGGWVGIPHLLGGSNHIEKWMEPVFGHGAAAAGSAHAGGVFNFSIITNAFASEGTAHAGEASVEMALMILAVVIGLLGIFIAYLMYIRFPALPGLFVRKFHGLFVLVNNKYWVDEIYHGLFVRGLFGLGQVCKRFVDEILIDGTINGIGYVLQGTGSVVRLLQSGRVQGYAFGMMIGAAAVLGYLVLRVLL